MFLRQLKIKSGDSILNAAFIKNGFLLLIPGLLSSLAIVLISSGKWHFIPKEVSLRLLQLIQFQMLGLTICKFGIDQTGFALLYKQPGSNLLIKDLFTKRVIPLAILYSIVISFFVGYLSAIVLCINLSLEVFALVVIAELNIAKGFKKISIIMLGGYPFLFAIVLSYSLFETPSFVTICVVFLTASVLKFIVSYRLRFKSETFVLPILDVYVVYQQFLNYVLFRGDQILIFSALFSAFWFSDNNFSRSSLVYLTKYPELINGLLTAVWVLYLPQLTKDFTSSFKLFLGNNKLFLFVLIAGICSVGIIHYLFGHISYWHPILLYTIFFLNIVLGIPVNMVTFHLLKEGRVKKIVQISVSSLLIGLLLFFISFYFQNSWFFVSIVPCQLLMYLSIFLFWKKEK